MFSLSNLKFSKDCESSFKGQKYIGWDEVELIFKAYSTFFFFSSLICIKMSSEIHNTGSH